MSKEYDLIKGAESCAAIGTQPQLSQLYEMIGSDRRLCQLCIMSGEDCEECHMKEVLEDVIGYALYQTQTVVAPRCLLRYALVVACEEKHEGKL